MEKINAWILPHSSEEKVEVEIFLYALVIESEGPVSVGVFVVKVVEPVVPKIVHHSSKEEAKDLKLVEESRQTANRQEKVHSLRHVSGVQRIMVRCVHIAAFHERQPLPHGVPVEIELFKHVPFFKKMQTQHLISRMCSRVSAGTLRWKQ